MAEPRQQFIKRVAEGRPKAIAEVEEKRLAQLIIDTAEGIYALLLYVSLQGMPAQGAMYYRRCPSDWRHRIRIASSTARDCR
jgi:hypothetical protein